ncbi:sodium/bile acid cotransporter [Brienomyrus brachyistius]|uniref:sodium/bile acid cotransporter n=1 Tax=Brienomyrus brachyistius TaxID=42636 RepID=UPI0020B451B9|nr:sodium/bile acid cotransporter [Brienomyrus brachyistius]
MNSTKNQTISYQLWDHASTLNITEYNSSVTFQSQFSAVIDQVIGGVTIIILFITMISLGCTMEVAKIQEHIAKPKGVVIAIVAQYGIMPLSAFTFAKIFQLGPVAAMTVLICGCCPGGNLSNIFTLGLQGDMNLSILLTTFSNVMGLGMMPLLLYVYYQGIFSLESAVPYGGITLALVLTLIPCAIGIAINHWAPRFSPIIIKVGLSTLSVTAIVIFILCGIEVRDTIGLVLSPPLVATAALMPVIGFLFGYMMAFIFNLNQQCRRTIAMETGCQNVQLGTTILKVVFPHEIIGPLFLFPLIYVTFQAGEAVLLTILFRCYQRFKTPSKKKTVYVTVNTEEVASV